MKERYSRNLGALTEAECATLQTKKVFVAGCGGLGGHIIDMLLRVGVGSLSVADGDTFDVTNLNRQLLSNSNNIGSSKAKAAADYAKLVNPDVSFTANECFVDENNVSQLLRGCDLVMDALDSVSARRLLKKECDRQNIPMVHGAISGWNAQVALSLPGDGLMDLLYPNQLEASGKSSLSCTPALCASLQVSVAVRYLCGREVRSSEVLFADLSDLLFERMF